MNASSKVILKIVSKFVTLSAEWHAVKQQHPYPEIAWAQNVWIDLSVVWNFLGSTVCSFKAQKIQTMHIKGPECLIVVQKICGIIFFFKYCSCYYSSRFLICYLSFQLWIGFEFFLLFYYVESRILLKCGLYCTADFNF